MESPSDHNMIAQPLLATSSKGGFRTLPFIIANEAFEKTASYGISPNMIVYLMKGYGMDMVTGSNVIYFWTAATNLAPVIGAILADSYVGRFPMIGFGSIISFLGMVLLWLTAVIPGAKPCDESGSKCTFGNMFQLPLLVSSLGLMSIGAGGIRASSLAFGADQLLQKDGLKQASILESFFNWYYVAATASILIASSILVYIQENFGWNIGFGLPVTLMLLSAISFFLASPFYIKIRVKASPLVRFVQVIVASWKKRHLTLSEMGDQVYYNRKGSRLIMPRENLRFLSKACIIASVKEELAPDGTAIDPWSLSSVDHVEEAKALIKTIPIWSTGIIMSVGISQASFPVLQAGSMDRHITSNFEIPAASSTMFLIISVVLWVIVYDRVIIPLATKMIGKPAHLSVRKRMGIGLLVSFLALAVSAIVEGIRRQTAVEEGFSDDAKGVVHMSVLWLVPHNCLFGISEALFVVGQNEFFYTELPKTMASVATNLSGVGMCLGSLLSSLIMSIVDSSTSKGGRESWVSSNINKAHFDYYYWVLAILCLFNFFYYLLCSRAYDSCEGQDGVWDGEQDFSDE